NLYQGRKRLGDLLQCWPPDVAARKELGRARDESLQHEAQVVFDALIVWREWHVAALCHVAMPPAASLAHTQQPARAYLPAKRTRSRVARQAGINTRPGPWLRVLRALPRAAH